MATKTFPLFCAGKTIEIDKGLLIGLDLFDGAPELFRKRPYEVQAVVDGGVFTEFCDAVEGKVVTVTKENVAGMEALCVELGFHRLDDAIAELRPASPAPGASRETGAMRKQIHEYGKVIEVVRAGLGAERSARRDADAGLTRETAHLTARLDETQKRNVDLQEQLERCEVMVRDQAVRLSAEEKGREALARESSARAKENTDIRAQLERCEAMIRDQAARLAALEEAKPEADKTKEAARLAQEEAAKKAKEDAAKKAKLAQEEAAKKAKEKEFKDNASLPGFQPGKLGTLDGMFAFLTRACGGNVHEKTSPATHGVAWMDQLNNEKVAVFRVFTL